MTTLTTAYQHPKLGKLSIRFTTDADDVVTSIGIQHKGYLVSLVYRDMTKRFDCYAALPFDKAPYIDFANSARMNMLFRQQLLLQAQGAAS